MSRWIRGSLAIIVATMVGITATASLAHAGNAKSIPIPQGSKKVSFQEGTDSESWEDGEDRLSSKEKKSPRNFEEAADFSPENKKISSSPRNTNITPLDEVENSSPREGTISISPHRKAGLHKVEFQEVRNQHELDYYLQAIPKIEEFKDILFIELSGKERSERLSPDCIDEIEMLDDEGGSKVRTLFTLTTPPPTGVEIHASDPVYIKVSGDAELHASGSAMVIASGNATVIASEDAMIIASGHAEVEVDDPIQVVDYGPGRLITSGNVTISATEQATTYMYEKAQGD
ncbi:MAG: hypothetical protein H0T78_03280 [Longispora sp.]|nr:hypothetical protein [Longispora sp. (in: high G+C Gram-positive bacteria)]